MVSIKQVLSLSKSGRFSLYTSAEERLGMYNDTSKAAMHNDASEGHACVVDNCCCQMPRENMVSIALN